MVRLNKIESEIFIRFKSEMIWSLQIEGKSELVNAFRKFSFSGSKTEIFHPQKI